MIVSAEALPSGGHHVSGAAGESRVGFGHHDPRIEYCQKGGALFNFGDYLPVLFASRMLLQPRIEADVYRLVGSVIDSSWILRDLRHARGVSSGTIVFWGCGKRDAAPLTDKAKRMSRFFGVRGPLTRDALGLPEDTVLGDPGLLLPLVHRPSPHPLTTDQAICVPHFEDHRSDEEISAITGVRLVVRPTVAGGEQPLGELLDKIASASFVLAGSLHAAITALAYRRPFAFWSAGHLDTPYKWEDFSGSVGAPCVFAKTLKEGIAIHQSQIAPVIEPPPLTPILDVCPFMVRPSAILLAMAHDGKLDPKLAETAATQFERLPSADGETVLQLQQWSDAWRRDHGSGGRMLASLLGNTRERAKDLAKAVLGLRS